MSKPPTAIRREDTKPSDGEMTQTTKTRKQSHEIQRQVLSGSSQQAVEHQARQDSSMKNSDIRFDDVISLTEVKDLARRLPPDSKARGLMFALNDNETRWIALGQLLLIHKFLWDEFKS